MTRKRQQEAGEYAISGLVSKSIDDVEPSWQNDTIYRRPNPQDPDFLELVKSVARLGIMEPIVVSKDGAIISGHRRYAAAKAAGLVELPCRVLDITSDDERFIPILREYNRQRIKTLDEVIREEIVSVDPDEAYHNLCRHRFKLSSSNACLDAVILNGEKSRSRISNLKIPLLNAAIRILNERAEGGFLPVNLRSIHYALLNDPPMFNNRRRYKNDSKSYQGLSDLLTRARLGGIIPEGWIVDETRPTQTWNVFQSATPFIRRELDGFLTCFYRDLMQTQPNHVEIWAEKLTVKPIVEAVASDYTIPVTICRGYPSLPPRQQLAARYRRSGRDKLIIIAVTDHDADGEEIVQSLGKSMRDDFFIGPTSIVKAALTRDQVDELDLPVSMEAKRQSSNYDKFVREYGTDAYELEALPPTELQRLLRETINSVIDVDAYNQQIELEKEDASHLSRVRQQVNKLLSTLDLGDGECN